MPVNHRGKTTKVRCGNTIITVIRHQQVMMMQETAHTGPWVVGYMYLRYFNEMEDVSGIVATYPPGRFSCRGCPLSWTLKNAETLAGEGSHSKEDSGPRTPPVHLPRTHPVRIPYTSINRQNRKQRSRSFFLFLFPFSLQSVATEGFACDSKSHGGDFESSQCSGAMRDASNDSCSHCATQIE